jgi:beta-lactamase class A
MKGNLYNWYMKKGYLLILAFALSGAGYFWHQSIVQERHDAQPYAAKKSCPYQNINPLRCEPELAVKKKEYVVLKNDLTDYIERRKKDGKLTSASVYFRDLQNGPTMSIDSQEFFIPASLLKLPLMMTYYKKAEDDPSLLKRKVVVAGDINSLPQNVMPEQTAQIGKTYTVDELIGLLIVQSDNTSWKMLLGDLRKNYSEDDFVSTLSDLGIVDPRKRNDQQFITVQGYASIFRILYNSSYLNIEMSDKALKLLSQSSFKDGIVAGVPEKTRIAHKFGEQRNGNEQQLHDCGIVYYPNNPYVICVMTKGYETTELTPIIKEISKKVYDEIESRN